MSTHGPLKEALDQQPYLQSYYAAADLALELKYGFVPVSVNTGTFIVTDSNLSSVSELVKEGKD